MGEVHGHDVEISELSEQAQAEVAGRAGDQHAGFSRRHFSLNRWRLAES